MENNWEIFNPITCQKEKENKREILKKVIELYCDDYITDDNPSKINSFTGLSQVLIYSLGIVDGLDLLELEDDMLEFSEVGLGSPIPFRDIPRHSFKEKLITTKLAQGYLRKILTDDAPSQWNGLSGLDQAICFEFGRIPLYRIKEIKKSIINLRPYLLGGVLPVPKIGTRI